MKCRHCGQANINRPRGLCWGCYYNPDVRERYPSTSKFARRGVCDRNGKMPQPPFPTQAMPGTADKVAVLEQRARLGQALWHPHDARFDPDAETPHDETLVLNVA